MRLFRFVLILTLAVAWFVVFSSRLSILPPLGKVLAPFTGFWQNAETEQTPWKDGQTITGLNDEVQILLDERRVPHIFANRMDDLLFVQGYVEARDRLWQMDFMSRLAGGRLAEVVGKPGIRIDRFFRRLGMVKAAQQDLEIILSDPDERLMIESYSRGVNAYISELSYAKYPVEFKMLDYIPERWSPLKSVLIVKLMTFNLAWTNQDLEHTQALQWYGREAYDQLYPDFPSYKDPVISTKNFYPDSTIALDTPEIINPVSLLPYQPPLVPNPSNGSNNWAIGGNRTASGYPILANDPHLGLNIPSIWYELQLKNGDYDMYGVSIPGVPGIIIGFNQHIAVGLTNAQRDVTDWYQVPLSAGMTYETDGRKHTLKMDIEEINVRGSSTFYDTVWQTHLGPIVFDTAYPGDSLRMGLAMHWMAHEPGSFLKTINALNHATNFQEYRTALSSYVTPAQNFAFAAQDGDIAITQQGKFPLFWPEQGKFLGDIQDERMEWQAFIPTENNPYEHNPPRGYVSSANQHPTQSDYPYYYQGSFEFYRNQRINQVLDSLTKATPEDMMALQGDNISLFARDALRLILPRMEGSWDGVESKWLEELNAWKGIYNPDDSIAPLFEEWWAQFKRLGKDTERLHNISLPNPKDYVLLGLIDSIPDHPYFDLDSTDTQESAFDILKITFKAAVVKIEEWQTESNKELMWSNYKGTHLTHWLNAIRPFNITHLNSGGNRYIVNATTANHGPSWRMVVSMEDPVKAWGVYPGGQSGNPGSPHYARFAEKWAAGEYYSLHYLKEPDSEHPAIVHTQTLQP